MVDVNLTISIITFKVNELKVVRMDKKKVLTGEKCLLNKEKLF